MKTLHIHPTGVGYHITVSVILGFLFGISVSNTMYFSELSETPNVSVSKGTLETMSGINVAISIVSGLVLLWSLYRVVSSHESKHKTMHEEYVRLTEYPDLGFENHKTVHSVDQHIHHHHHQNQPKTTPKVHSVKPKPIRTGNLPTVF